MKNLFEVSFKEYGDDNILKCAFVVAGSPEEVFKKLIHAGCIATPFENMGYIVDCVCRSAVIV